MAHYKPNWVGYNPKIIQPITSGCWIPFFYWQDFSVCKLRHNIDTSQFGVGKAAGFSWANLFFFFFFLLLLLLFLFLLLLEPNKKCGETDKEVILLYVIVTIRIILL